MSNLYTQPWTSSEKTSLLVNVIQGSVPDVPSFLLQGILESNIQPKWPEIALPTGRSLHACQLIYDELMRSAQRPRSFSSLPLQAPGFTQTPLSAHVPFVRAVSEHDILPPAQRAIQPRPPRSTDSPLPVSNGEAFTILRPFAPEVGVERRRKRGRPTKEEVEERDRRLAATGQTYAPKKRPMKKSRPSETPQSLADALTPASPESHTPLLQLAEAGEKTSSGKRGTRGQQKDETIPEHAARTSPGEDSGNELSTEAAQSPSDRLLLRSNERGQTMFPLSRDVLPGQSPLDQGFEQLQEESSIGPPSI